MTSHPHITLLTEEQSIGGKKTTVPMELMMRTKEKSTQRKHVRDQMEVRDHSTNGTIMNNKMMHMSHAIRKKTFED